MSFIISPPRIIRSAYKNAEWDIQTNNKEIFLTFDDGPTKKITDWILDVLKDFEAKATFFCIGKNVIEYKKKFNRIINENHTVGNHTFNHLNGWKTDDNIYFKDIEFADKYINTQLFRPPYGRISFNQLKFLSKKKRVILWDVLSKDYDINTKPEKVFDIVKNHAVNGSIVVFHDSIKAEKNMKFTLTRTLKHFYDLGYKFSKI